MPSSFYADPFDMKPKHFLFIGMIAVVGMVIYFALDSQNIDNDYIDEVSSFRTEKNRRFKNNTDKSPLDKAGRAAFDTLPYYPINPAYRIQADYTRLKSNEVVQIPTTSGGKPQSYVRYAMASFQLEGKQHELVLLKPVENIKSQMLYLFFKDATSGTSTYGGGRQVEVKEGKISCTIDFNMAFNPYCAYNSYYICPIPPKENMISVPIEAGEKYMKQGSHE